MTEEQIQEELFNAACDGDKQRFAELEKQLEQINKNSMFADICSDMFKNHSKIKQLKYDNFQEGGENI